jgi:arsenate reductase
MALYQFYYIKTCDTSLKILKQLAFKKFELIDTKTHPITIEQLELLRKLAGSYETLFSKKAKKYTEMGLKNRSLPESDYKRLILDEYTFLKRPIVIINNEIFVGSDKKTVNNLLQKIKELSLA